MSEFRRSRRPDSTAVLADLAVAAWQPAAELGLLLADPIYWGWGVPRGDSHAVLVLPGLLAIATWSRCASGCVASATRPCLRYPEQPGWSEELVQELGEIATAAHERTGRRVTIIGHSLGGLLGRSVAVRRPGSCATSSRWAHRCAWSTAACPRRSVSRRSTARRTGLCAIPAACPGARRAHRVRGSHIGLAFSPEVYRALARLLSGRRGIGNRSRESGVVNRSV
jgi:pimeloyl-ACP methyl ester carboxylesterase